LRARAFLTAEELFSSDLFRRDRMSDSRHRHAGQFGAELDISGLAAGTNWVFRDESMHINSAFEVINTVRAENPELFDSNFETQVVAMLEEAVDCETPFAEDLLGQGGNHDLPMTVVDSQKSAQLILVAIEPLQTFRS
jgi:hypothetical protein